MSRTRGLIAELRRRLGADDPLPPPPPVPEIPPPPARVFPVEHQRGRFAARAAAHTTALLGIGHVGTRYATDVVLQFQAELAVAHEAVAAELPTEWPAVPSDYEALVICLGMYPTNTSLTSGQASALASYLSAGGAAYLEGGNSWASATGASIYRPWFGISSAGSGASWSPNELTNSSRQVDNIGSALLQHELVEPDITGAAHAQ